MNTAPSQPTSTAPAVGAGLVWRTSSHSSGNGGDCVEVAALPDGHHAVRDSKNPDQAMLVFTTSGWTAFLTAIHHGHISQ